MKFQRPGVHAEQRQPVSQHVVHLPGDAPPLGLPRLLGAAFLVGCQPLGPLPERGDQLAPGAQIQAQPNAITVSKNAGNPTLTISPAAGLTSGNTTPAAAVSTTTAVRARPRSREAAVQTATSPAPRASGENVFAAKASTNTAIGWARRHHSARHATAPAATSTASRTTPWLCHKYPWVIPPQHDREREQRRIGQPAAGQAGARRSAEPQRVPPQRRAGVRLLDRGHLSVR